jgi:hypothetical protein
MYIEQKDDGVSGDARIGRVYFSKRSKTLHYKGRSFASLNGRGFKTNYFDIETHEEVWISGCKKKGGDRLYPGIIEIDDDVLEEYWTTIRNLPENKNQEIIRCVGKYRK